MISVVRSTEPSIEPGWFLRSLVWFGQTAVAAFFVFLCAAVVGVDRTTPPLALLAVGGAVTGPFLLLRQVDKLIETRLADD